ncbi:hypothetical protein AAMO2058_001543500 [Amorphochlora amoebiformis]
MPHEYEEVEDETLPTAYQASAPPIVEAKAQPIPHAPHIVEVKAQPIPHAPHIVEVKAQPIPHAQPHPIVQAQPIHPNYAHGPPPIVNAQPVNDNQLNQPLVSRRMLCPHCHRECELIGPQEPYPSPMAWGCCVFLFCFFWPCMCLPFCIDDCYEKTKGRCSHCNRVIR